MKKTAGFTLVETLVTVAVLAIIALLLTRLAEGTRRVTSAAHQRLSADSAGRQVLDRIDADLRHAILRDDLPGMVEKLAGNDRLSFFTQVDGYFPDPDVPVEPRGLSRSTYEAPAQALVRIAQGMDWAGTVAKPVFGGTNAASNLPALQEVVAPDAFRLELAFLLNNGSRVAAKAEMVPGREPTDVRAIIVSVATLDRGLYPVLASRGETVADVAALLVDAEDGVDIVAPWRSAIDAADLPGTVRQGVQIYQRVLYLE